MAGVRGRPCALRGGDHPGTHAARFGPCALRGADPDGPRRHLGHRGAAVGRRRAMSEIEREQPTASEPSGTGPPPSHTPPPGAPFMNVLRWAIFAGVLALPVAS